LELVKIGDRDSASPPPPMWWPPEVTPVYVALSTHNRFDMPGVKDGTDSREFWMTDFFCYNVWGTPYYGDVIYNWIYLNYVLFLGGMFFAFGSTCAESHWIWYSISMCFWTILPSRQMAMLWCHQENTGLLKVQFSAGLTVGNLFLCVILLLNIHQIAVFTSPETITVVTLEVTAEIVLEV
jgi:hypothetical protein